MATTVPRKVLFPIIWVHYLYFFSYKQSFCALSHIPYQCLNVFLMDLSELLLFNIWSAICYKYLFCFKLTHPDCKDFYCNFKPVYFPSLTSVAFKLRNLFSMHKGDKSAPFSFKFSD